MQRTIAARRVTAATVALVLALSGQARGDFILFGNEHLDVTTTHMNGTLWDSSSVSVLDSGSVDTLSAGHFSTVDISGGSVKWLDARYFSAVDISGGRIVHNLIAYDSSTVNIFGGQIDHFSARDSSTVDVSGGEMDTLHAGQSSTVDIFDGEMNNIIAADSSTVSFSGRWVKGVTARDSSTMDISGGSLGVLGAFHSTVVTFYGEAFYATGDITFDGQRVLGVGILAGQWADGTPWAVKIDANHPSATILAVPEPSTLALLTMGAVGLLAHAWRRRRKTEQR